MALVWKWLDENRIFDKDCNTTVRWIRDINF